MAIPREKRVCRGRRQHTGRLGIHTVLAWRRGEGGAVLRRLEQSLGRGRGDRRTVTASIIDGLQICVEVDGVVVCRVFLHAWLSMLFHVLCVWRRVGGGVVAIPREKRVCLGRRQHTGRLGIHTVLAWRRGEGEAVLRCLEQSLGRGRGDRRTVTASIIDGLQICVEVYGVVVCCVFLRVWLRMLFHVLCVPRDVSKGQRARGLRHKNPLRLVICA